MNWDAIGAIGELIGALAVLVTLLYLATQIKQNTRALSGASMDSITDHGLEELRWSADLQPLLVKARNDPESVSETERRQLVTWVIASFRNRQNEYFQWKFGALNEEVLDANSGITKNLLTVPFAKDWFDSAGKSVLAPDFCKYVESLPDADETKGHIT